MDYGNNDWLPGFPLGEDENNWNVDGDPYNYAIPQENTSTLDINAHQGQVHGSYNYTAHVATSYHQMNSASPVPLMQEHVTASAHEELCPDTMPTPQGSFNEPYNLEKICSVHRRSGSDDMSFRCLVSGCHQSHNRWPDFLRHYNGSHAVKKKVFWCPKDGCARNKAVGNNPFPRKDKLKDHIRQAHGDRHSS